MTFLKILFKVIAFWRFLNIFDRFATGLYSLLALFSGIALSLQGRCVCVLREQPVPLREANAKKQEASIKLRFNLSFGFGDQV